MLLEQSHVRESTLYLFFSLGATFEYISKIDVCVVSLRLEVHTVNTF